MKHGKKMIKVLFLLLVVLGGLAAALYTQAIPEAAKLLLLGAVLIGVAQWGRRHMKESEEPIAKGGELEAESLESRA